jgi:hypothetical protein
MNTALVAWTLAIVTSTTPIGTGPMPVGAIPAASQFELAISPLMAAVRRQDEAGVRQLLQKGADPNEISVTLTKPSESRQTDKFESPLLVAVRQGNDAIARLLLDAGARVRWRDGRGRTTAELAAALNRSESLRARLSQAEQREFTLTPDWSLPELVALMALENIARTYGSPQARAQMDTHRLRRIGEIAEILWRRWPTPAPPRSPSLASSLTRDVNSLEWAIQRADNDVLRTVADDLETKLQDCLSSPERAFGEVKISVRTLLPDGTERRGLRVRYVERFFWDLLAKVPDVASQWKEFAAATAVVEEPVPAGDYVIVARSSDGRDLSEAKPISVSRNRSTRFDLILR